MIFLFSLSKDIFIFFKYKSILNGTHTHQPDIKNIKVLYIYSVSANMIDIPTERYVEFLIYTSFNLIYVFEIKYNFATDV